MGYFRISQTRLCWRTRRTGSQGYGPAVRRMAVGAGPAARRALLLPGRAKSMSSPFSRRHSASSHGLPLALVVLVRDDLNRLFRLREEPSPRTSRRKKMRFKAVVPKPRPPLLTKLEPHDPALNCSALCNGSQAPGSFARGPYRHQSGMCALGH